MNNRNESLRDRMWIWSHEAGSWDNQYNLPAHSTITPADAAAYLGVPNAFFIRYSDKPVPPYDATAAALQPLKRVVWSLVGAGGATQAEDRRAVLELAERYPHITDFVMDDFFHADGAGSLTVEELRQLRSSLVVGGTQRDLYVVLYTNQLDLPVADHLAQCDKIMLWTWHAEDLDHLEANLAKAEQLAPHADWLLGCYLWDFGNQRPLPIERMQRQCELGLHWLKSGRISGMVFCGSCVCDLGLDTVAFTREWIAGL